MALDASELSRAADLRAEAAAAARNGLPLIVLYSRDDCTFCQTIKREHLAPMAADTRRGKRLMIREIAQDRDTPLTDFQGQSTTHAAFAAREKIRLVPVVAFYGPNGRKLADPIVGARLPDFYQSYLDDAIEQASRKLKQP
ncbi:MAG: thioredoxin family protein [Azonexus sp.]